MLNDIKMLNTGMYANMLNMLSGNGLPVYILYGTGQIKNRQMFMNLCERFAAQYSGKTIWEYR